MTTDDHSTHLLQDCPTPRCSQAGSMAGGPPTEGQALRQPGGPAENGSIYIRARDRRLHLSDRRRRSRLNWRQHDPSDADDVWPASEWPDGSPLAGAPGSFPATPPDSLAAARDKGSGASATRPARQDTLMDRQPDVLGPVNREGGRNECMLVCPSIYASFYPSIHAWIYPGICRLINQSINQWMNEWLNQSINQSIDRSIDRSINQSINQSIDQSINRPIKQASTKQINISINQPSNQPSNQSINQANKSKHIRG